MDEKNEIRKEIILKKARREDDLLSLSGSEGFLLSHLIVLGNPTFASATKSLPGLELQVPHPRLAHCDVFPSAGIGAFRD